MSGWSVMTVSPPKSLSVEARDTAHENIETCLMELYGEDTEGYADRTVQLPRGTASYQEDDYAAQSYADEVFENCPSAKWVVVVDANDTSDSGTGEVYKREDGETVGVGTKVGYNGANGRDVVGWIDDEYNLPSYASFEA